MNVSNESHKVLIDDHEDEGLDNLFMILPNTTTS